MCALYSLYHVKFTNSVEYLKALNIQIDRFRCTKRREIKWVNKGNHGTELTVKCLTQYISKEGLSMLRYQWKPNSASGRWVQAGAFGRTTQAGKIMGRKVKMQWSCKSCEWKRKVRLAVWLAGKEKRKVAVEGGKKKW